MDSQSFRSLIVRIPKHLFCELKGDYTRKHNGDAYERMNMGTKGVPK